MFLQETSGKLLTGETTTDEVGALHPGAAVEGRELFGEGRRRQSSQTEPIDIVR